MSAVFFYKSTRFPCEIDPINYVNQKFMRFYVPHCLEKNIINIIKQWRISKYISSANIANEW